MRQNNLLDLHSTAPLAHASSNQSMVYETCELRLMKGPVKSSFYRNADLRLSSTLTTFLT